MEPGARCYMCKEWQEDKCRQHVGRCGFRESSIVDAATLDGGSAPAWIEVWMKDNADASNCGGLELTVAGKRDMGIFWREQDAAVKEMAAQAPADAHEWARKAAGAR